MRRALGMLVAIAAGSVVASAANAAEGRTHVSARGSATVFVETLHCPGFATAPRFPGSTQIGFFVEAEWFATGELKFRVFGSGIDPNTGATYTLKAKLARSGGPDLLGSGEIRLTRDDGVTMSGDGFFNIAGPMSPEIVITVVDDCA